MARIRYTEGEQQVAGLGIVGASFVECSEAVAQQFFGRNGWEVKFEAVETVEAPSAAKVMVEEVVETVVSAPVITSFGKSKHKILD